MSEEGFHLEQMNTEKRVLLTVYLYIYDLSTKITLQ